MSHLAATMKSIAHNYSVAVTCTNSMVADMSSSNQLKPALGKTWTHVPHCRIALEKTSVCGNHTATLLKSSRQPTGISVSFVINERGLDTA